MIQFTVTTKSGIPITGAEVSVSPTCSDFLGVGSYKNPEVIEYTDDIGIAIVHTGCAFGGLFNYTVSASGYKTISGSGSQGGGDLGTGVNTGNTYVKIALLSNQQSAGPNYTGGIIGFFDNIGSSLKSLSWGIIVAITIVGIIVLVLLLLMFYANPSKAIEATNRIISSESTPTKSRTVRIANQSSTIKKLLKK